MEELLAARVVPVVPVVHVEARLLVASGYRKVETVVEELLGATYYKQEKLMSDTFVEVNMIIS